MTKKSKALVIIMGLIIVIMGVVMAIILTKGKKVDTASEQTVTEPERRSTLISEDNVDEVIEEMANREYVEPGYYNVRMNTEWHFESGDAECPDSYVENSEMNTSDVYFDILLAEDEEQVLYKSPIIPVGKTLNNVKLDKKLDAGSHDCIMVYHLVDENQNTTSTLRVSFTIVIES